ncbi:ABC transporter permease [Streptomyces corynorhini]|uniref:ABC transporter permease n=1 Tax=Streptomyces corynorhini TaxID=2282652 RepID=UPI001F223A2D|nr:ABC transporter permease [Streptomyces corynorhini]
MPSSPPRRLIAVMLLIPLVAALALWAFAWPAARIAPRDLPLGIAGPPAAADPLASGLERDHRGAFELHRYPDEAAARRAVESRAVYGAVVAGPEGVRLLTASAASPVVAQLLTQAVTARAPGRTPVPVVDVVPTPSADPRGGVLGASLLPLALAGIVTGAAVTVLGLRGTWAALGLTGAAAAAGVAVAALAHSWLGVLTGDWWAEAGSIGLTVLAIGAAVAGLATLIGRAGIALGSVVMVLLGNSFSGVTSAPELLPAPIGAIGQRLPPGAGGSLLRSVAYFDGSAAGTPLLTLSLWAALGLAAVLAGGRIGKPAPAGDDPVAENRTATAVPVG